MKVFFKGFILFFVLSFVHADEVRRIILPIYQCPGCGGHQLSIKLQTGWNSRNSCSTTIKESFSSGELLTWSGRQLGDCQGFQIDSRTRIRLHTDHSNQYAVQGTMTFHTGSNEYRANIPNAWRGTGDNSETYRISISESESVERVESLWLKNGGQSGNDQCRGYDISVKLVNGEEECTVENKSEFWENRNEVWEGAELSECRYFRFDKNTIAYILVNSNDELFCPQSIEVHMNDSQGHKFEAIIAHSVSRTRLGGFNRHTNTRQINGFRQIWPRENRIPHERIPEVTCPSQNDPNTCPSQFMTAYETSSHQSMNCAFTCSAIKSIPSSADFNSYNGTGLQCFAVDYLSPQFNWCCKTRRVHETIPKCSEVGVRDSEWRVTTNNDINTYSHANAINNEFSSSDDFDIANEPTCPEYGCPIEHVEKIVDRGTEETSNWTCDVTDGCDYVRSEDTSDPNSGISCQETRRQRRPSKFCCNMNGDYDGDLPRCSILRDEIRRQRIEIASDNPPQRRPNNRSHRSHTQGMNFTVEGRDYHVVMKKKTNEEAKNHCRHEVFRGRQGKLFEPKDRRSYLEVIRNVERIVTDGRRMWMGIERNPLDTSKFRYMSDAEPLVNGIADWGPGQPDDYQDSEDCVEYWTSKAWKHNARLSKQWNDIKCSHQRTAICEAI